MKNLVEDAEGLLAVSSFTLGVNGREVPVHRAQPEGQARLPVMLVISEIPGVHEQVAEVAHRFARQGYMTLVPDLFAWQGDNPDKVIEEKAFADLDAVVAWAKANGGNGDKISITGFSRGGHLTWRYAAHNPAIKAGVAWYGRLAGDASVNFPRQAGHAVGAVMAPALALYDARMPAPSQPSPRPGPALRQPQREPEAELV